MKIVLLAGPVLMSVQLKQSLKVIFIKLTLKFAPIVAPVQMFALSKQSTLHSFSVQG